ncbi:hypothetical protein PWT90_09533 [Aphanocladium album]|nr:hypothetical protein PWT90_09533 [Aphanocladium album]
MAFAVLPVEHGDSTAIVRGGGVRAEPTTAVTIRQRPRVTRTRTGCLTCRSRHLKCDEHKPACLRCIESRRECRGYNFGWPASRPGIFQTSLKDKVGDEASGSGLFEDTVVYGRWYTEPEPPRWEEMEALRYSKDDPSIRGAWATVSRQVAELLASVNKDLSAAIKSPHESLETFQKIFHLTFYDLAVNPSALRQHSSGYRALMEHVGGARVLMRETDLQFNFTQFSMLVGFEAYTDEDLTKLVNVLGERNFHVPLPLFIIGNRLTELRRQVAEGTCTSSALKLAVRCHFDAIGAFDADEWARSSSFEEDSPASVFARIFQVAVRLYGILSLPPSAIDSWAIASSHPRLPRLSVYDSVLVSHRRKLLQQLYPYRGTFSNKRDMTWPLVVVGASLTGDGQVEDRSFVAESLLDIWRNPLARCSPLLCLEKLRLFWASGKTAWDDCFYETTPCVA